MYVTFSFKNKFYIFYLIPSSQSYKGIIITINLLIMKLWFYLAKTVTLANDVTVIERKYFMVSNTIIFSLYYLDIMNVISRILYIK